MKKLTNHIAFSLFEIKIKITNSHFGAHQHGGCRASQIVRLFNLSLTRSMN